MKKMTIEKKKQFLNLHLKFRYMVFPFCRSERSCSRLVMEALERVKSQMLGTIHNFTPSSVVVSDVIEI